MTKPKKTVAKNNNTAGNNPPEKRLDTEMSIYPVFPTFIAHKRFMIPGLNDALRLEIYKDKSRNPAGTTKSNTAGTWHSDTKLLDRLRGPVPQFESILQNTVLSYTTAYGADPSDEIGFKMFSWAMVYNDGGYATVHTHPNAHYAAVYYLDNPGAGIERNMVTTVRQCPGDIEFLDVRNCEAFQPPGLPNQTRYTVTPTAGDMLIFPAWLPHFVHPMIGDEDRMCIATNITIHHRKVQNPPTKET